MNELRNEWRGLRVKGQTRNRGEKKGAPGLCSPQETNLSAEYTCTFISLYIKYNKV